MARRIPEARTEATARPSRTLAIVRALLVALLLSAHYAASVVSLRVENPTVDEVNHLPAGISYWQTASFRLYHHNPPLIKMAAALPVVLAGVDLQRLYQSPLWKVDSIPPSAGGNFLLMLNAGRYFELFAMARMVMPLFSVLGGLILFLWSRTLFGDCGGFLSLILWCLCPNILAHGRLVTSDVGAAAIGFAATYSFWLYLKSPSWKRAVAAGILLGLAQLSKFSLLLLYPLWPILWVAFEIARPRGESFNGRVMRAGLHAAIVVSMSLLTINAGYGFEGLGRPLGRYPFASRSLTRPGSTPGQSANGLINLFWRHRESRFRGTWLAAIPAPLPSPYLLGFDEQKIESEGIPTVWVDPNHPDPDAVQGYSVYLDGVLRDTGWRSYYALAVLYKTPEGTLILFAAALAVFATRRQARAAWRDEFVIAVVPLAFFGAMTFLTDINIGLRYVLPCYPYAFLFIGRLGRWADGLTTKWRRPAWAILGGLVLATAAATISIHPHYLAYFNLASGGPDRDPPRLIDSNLDWGQDLVGLREWVRSHPGEGPIGVAYFGQITPNLFAARGDGFEWFLPPARVGTIYPMTDSPEQIARLTGAAARLRPGLYAVSATLLQGLKWRVYDPSRDAFSGTWDARQHAFSYFRAARPIGRIGHSILLYRLTAADVERLEIERRKRISP